MWRVVFKGWWQSGEGQRCEPLGIRDLFSRFILCMRAMRRRGVADVRGVCAKVFDRYGLPSVVVSEKGAPFASLTGPHGLTRLSAWWRTLGIKLVRIVPGQP